MNLKENIFLYYLVLKSKSLKCLLSVYEVCVMDDKDPPILKSECVSEMFLFLRFLISLHILFLAASLLLFRCLYMT